MSIEVKPNTNRAYTASTTFTLMVSGVADMSGSSSRSFSPSKLTLAFNYDSESEQWTLYQWTVSGCVRLKNGGLSENLSGKRYGWGLSTSRSLVPPEWVTQAAEWYRPTGTITFKRAGIWPMR